VAAGSAAQRVKRHRRSLAHSACSAAGVQESALAGISSQQSLPRLRPPLCYSFRQLAGTCACCLRATSLCLRSAPAEPLQHSVTACITLADTGFLRRPLMRQHATADAASFASRCAQRQCAWDQCGTCGALRLRAARVGRLRCATFRHSIQLLLLFMPLSYVL
jgi:hypothetical protein